LPSNCLVYGLTWAQGEPNLVACLCPLGLQSDESFFKGWGGDHLLEPVGGEAYGMP